MVLSDTERRGEADPRPRRVLEGRRGYAVVDNVDRLYLRRAVELAARGVGNTAPNPPVGAVLVRDGRTLGEGYHHRRGLPHAEVEALRDAGDDARGATAYVSLEPCNHHGLTPPCSEALIAAGVTRVVIGAADPNPKTDGGGMRRLREAGIAVELADDPDAQRVIEPFARAIRSTRPFVTLKMAASLDGRIAPRAGTPYWLTGDAVRERVRELRAAHDAVMVGAGTVRIDDPQLTIRPPHARLVPLRRVVVCERDPVPATARIFAEEAGTGRTIVLAPAGARARFGELVDVADVLFIGDDMATDLDLAAALDALKAAGVSSVLCEGGPTLAGRLVARRLIDRLVWFVAPTFLGGPDAVPALAGADLGNDPPAWRFDAIERIGDDLMLTAELPRV